MSGGNISKEESHKLMRLATMASVFVAFTIIGVKMLAWVMTGSLSLLSSLVDSVLDIFASIISFYAVRYSMQPADDDHRFGHGKAEDIAAFAQSAFIAGSGLFIVIEAINRFFNPREVINEDVGIIVMVISSIFTFALVSFQSYVVKKTKSTAIQADSLHYKMDFLVNIVVIGAFVLIMATDFYWADPIIAFAIALYIIISAYKVGRLAFDKLMDKEMSDDDRKNIMDAILANKNVRGVHDLRTRFSGITPFIQVHVELDASITLRQAHNICNEIERDLMDLYQGSEVIIHQDTDDEIDVALEKGRAVSLENNNVKKKKKEE